jgi:hypothetical protein
VRSGRKHAPTRRLAEKFTSRAREEREDLA